MQRSGEEGSALVYVTFLALAVGGLIAASTMRSLASSRLSVTKANQMRAAYLADAGLARAKASIREAIAGYTTIPVGGFTSVDGQTVDYVITDESTGYFETDAVGIRTYRDQYRVRAVARAGGTRVTRTALFVARRTPLYQYAVFYENDMLVTPTPPMTIRGRVHTNSDLYVGSSSNTISFDSNHMRVVGQLHRRYRPGSVPTGNHPVRIRRWVDDPFDVSHPYDWAELESKSTMDSLGIASAAGYDSEFAGHDDNADGDFDDAFDWPPFEVGSISRFSDPVGSSETTLRTGANGALVARPPPIDTTDAYIPNTDGDGDFVWNAGSGWFERAATPGTGSHDQGAFHRQADLSIRVSADHSTWIAFDSGGFDVTGSVASAVSLATIYDHRQGGYNPVVRLDMGALNSSVARPANGVLHISHQGMGTGTNAKGVELHNGATLAAPLTVVTDGPVYLNGDYNTVAPKPAAVISDALNLLSNAWVNDHTVYVNATNTTYNVAVIAGDTPADAATYNGGLENLPRFHENWNTLGATCTLRGSIVVPWHSRYANAPFIYARRHPPIRNFVYDPRFNDAAQLPPAPPSTVEMETVAIW